MQAGGNVGKALAAVSDEGSDRCGGDGRVLSAV